MDETILITGAAGSIATLVRPLLRSPGRTLRLLDITPVQDLEDSEEYVEASITDLEAMTDACRGSDLVVHLGGHSSERPWQQILETNINGAYVVLEAAHRAGVRRLLLASSVHAVGYVRVADAASAAVLPPRPDTFYGVSKVALEALGSLYADRFGLSIVSARICTAAKDPREGGRTLSTWVSPADLARLVEAALANNTPGHHIVWGVSANTRTWFSLEAGHAIGYHPTDNADHHPHSNTTPPAPTTHLAGPFIDQNHPLGKTW